MLKVSIIIINYNTFQFTCNCIDSVIKFTQDIDYEIILVDNASNECDPALFLEKFPTIKLIASKENSGFAGGNNLGIKSSKGEYILLLNSDTWLLNNAVKLSIDKMILQNIKVSSCRIYNTDMSIQKISVWELPSLINSVKNLIGFKKIKSILNKKYKNPYDCEFEFEPEAIIGAYFLFNREILNFFTDYQLPDKYFMYGEDTLWCWILKEKKVTIKYYTEPEIVHIFSGNKKYKTAVNIGYINNVDFLYTNFSKITGIFILLINELTMIVRFNFNGSLLRIKYFLSHYIKN